MYHFIYITLHYIILYHIILYSVVTSCRNIEGCSLWWCYHILSTVYMCLLRCMFSVKLGIVGLLKALLQERFRKLNCKHFHEAAEENCDILDQLLTTMHRAPLCEHSSSSASKALQKLKNLYLHKHVYLLVWMEWITFVQQVHWQLKRQEYIIYIMHLKLT